MTKELARRIDPIKASIEHLLVLSFGKSTSQSYPVAVNIAQGASYYEEVAIGNKLVHFAVFSKTREGAGRARALFGYTSDWKSTQVFAGGKIVQRKWELTDILECYLEATACTDWTAHCHRVIDDPYKEEEEDFDMSLTLRVEEGPEPIKEKIEIDRHIFPCEHILSHGFTIQKDHPAKPQDQIQAKSVKKGCDWCPNFDSAAYRKIGTRTIYKDAFT